MEGVVRSLADSERDAAYEYLCRLEEAKRWTEEMIKEVMPPLTEFEDCLANGVYLCKLGMALLPDDPVWKKVYDLDQSKYLDKGLDFRHTDNLNFFIDCLPQLGLSKVFYPCVSDIYERRNMFKLIYCLHALSHLLRKQGKTKKAVSNYSVSPTINDEVLKKATLTLRENSTHSFEIVESLVEEELQYAQIGIIEHETTENEESKSLKLPVPPVINGRSHGNYFSEDKDISEESNNPSSDSTSMRMFDDPKYVFVSSDGTILDQDEDNVSPPPAAAPINEIHPSFEINSILSDLKCQGAGISVSIYNGFCGIGHADKAELIEALAQINECVKTGNAKETLKALQNPNANLPFPYLEAVDYYSALVFEKNNGIPNNVIAVYKGLQRSLCDTLLEKLRPGAYLLRQSTTLSNGEFVFSFRNQVGIKHWKLSINKHGKLSLNNAQNVFDSLELFVKYFIDALSRVTKLFVYPGIAFMLKLNTSTLNTDQIQILKGLREAFSSLSYGQIAYVISDVNSRIRKERANSREVQPTVVNSRKCRTTPIAYSSRSSSKPLVLSLLEEEGRTTWDTSMIMRISRKDADELLEREGYPGSFLVRPSENASNNYALAFRTRKDTRRWRIVKSNGKFFVHPRPNPYNSLRDIITHFCDAVGAETGLTMTPLSVDSSSISSSPMHDKHRTIGGSQGFGTGTQRTSPSRKLSHDDVLQHNNVDEVPPIPVRRGVRHITAVSPSSDTVISRPSPSMSRLNPANITSWSVDDVSQWLLMNGLGKFTEVFKDNCVDGECLLTLDNNLLKDDLKITQLGYRSKIINRVETLKMTQYSDQQIS